MADSIGVIGAGTMGSGIAQTALTAGFSVLLYDVDSAALARAKLSIQNGMNRLVEKGQITEANRETFMQRLQLITNLSPLTSTVCVIEAVPERLELKRKLLRVLDSLLPPHVILGTNTSSLSVNVLSSSLEKHPERFIGIHFFNPAPVMELVEIVSSEDVSEDIVDKTIQLCRQFGKHPITCQDTPGFIVNRVNRNYYGEALRIVSEGTASVTDVDRLFEGGTGFRMGPFSLMDLIGIDVNYDVTQSVYHAMHEEPRYRPNILQERLVQSGRLGRKTGRGFYRYGEDGKRQGGGLEQSIPVTSEEEMDCTTHSDLAPNQIQVIGDTPLAANLRRRLAAISVMREIDTGAVYSRPISDWDKLAIQWRTDEIEAHLRRRSARVIVTSFAGDTHYHRAMLQAVEKGVRNNALILVSLAGHSATEQASWLRSPESVRGFSWFVANESASALQNRLMEWSRPTQAMGSVHDVDSIVIAFARMLGSTAVQVRDAAGGVAMRVLCMVMNEAVELSRERAANPTDIDTAMKLGANYPMGPFEWIDKLGVHSVYFTLAGMQREFGEERYRPSIALRQWMLASMGMPTDIYHGSGATNEVSS